MIKYRAIRRKGDFVWHIEEWDTEFQVASISNDVYISQAIAENWIKYHIIPNSMKPTNEDNGEQGEWINGPL
jgi:hypothetical protein